MPSQTSNQSSYVPIHFGKKASALSKEQGLWLLANVDQNIAWTQRKVMIEYRERKVLLLPETKIYHAAAALITKDHSLKEGKTFLMEFLSALAWTEQGKIDIVRWTNSTLHSVLANHLRLPLAKSPGITHLFFRPTELPNPSNPKSQLALALYREGMSLSHPRYAFLSYFKIINLRYPNKDKQRAWIKRNLPLIENLNHLKDRFIRLKAEYTDPVAYIYEACRCAVAHATMKQITYNPESVEDEMRFYEIAPIMHALAKLMIEKEFSIKAKFTIFDEHLYELEGFYQLLGEKISKSLKECETLSLSEIQLATKISLRIWNKSKLKAFENLQPTVIKVNKGVVTLSLTRDNIIKIQIVLDFPKEKLIFDPTQPIDFNDDGTKNAALQLSNAYQFYSEFMGNPVLEVWETNSNMNLGRLLEYLPTVRPGQPLPHVIKEQCISKMKEWKQIAKERSARLNR